MILIRINYRLFTRRNKKNRYFDLQNNSFSIALLKYSLLLQEDSLINHIAAKIVENVATTKGQIAQVSVYFFLCFWHACCKIMFLKVDTHFGCNRNHKNIIVVSN